MKESRSTTSRRKSIRSHRLRIALRLKEAGAKVFRIAGTPLDKPEFDEAQMIPRNRTAAEVMERLSIPVLDAYGFMKPLKATTQKSNDVHFTDAGDEALAGFLAPRIKEALGRWKDLSERSAPPNEGRSRISPPPGPARGCGRRCRRP